MRELYTLELARLVKELKELGGFYVDQFYETEHGRFRIKLGNKGEKLNLQCIIPYTINRTDRIEVKEAATNFSIAVRKRICGARIKSVEQINNDRLIKIAVEKSGSEIDLVFEMFGKGNLVITDTDMKILLAYQVHEFKDRSIRPGAKYVVPANQSIDVLKTGSLDSAREEMELARGGGSVVVYLSKKLGIGRMYVEESIRRSGIEIDSKVSDLDADAYGKLFKNLKELIDECTKKPAFTAYEKNGAVANFSLCRIGRYESFSSKEFGSLERCLDFVYGSAAAGAVERNEEEEKIIASIEKQRMILKGIKDEIKNNRIAGDYIMNSMHELNSMIGEIRQNRNATKEELKRLSDKIEILSISMKTKTIRIKPKEGDD